jgi:alanine transaminase
MVIIADEVYQLSIHNPLKQFISFKKAVREIEPPYNQTTLVSLHSISKGFTGSCGLRGGYMEFVNVEPKIMELVYTLRDVTGINVTGSIAVNLVCEV